MRKKALEKRMQRLLAKKAKIEARAAASEDAAEVRDLTDQLEEVKEEIAETQEEIDAIDEEERSTAPVTAQKVNADVIKTFTTEKRETEDTTATVEYRQAFMKYVQTGKAMQIRNGEVIDTADTGAAIPSTIMNDVINTVKKKYGNLYSKVRKISVKGGVEFPIGALQASFKWINESTVSPRQNVGNLSKVTFGYHTAEIRIAQTFLSSLLTLSSFESKLTEIIAIAYLQAMDNGIINGTGAGQMTGILNDSRITNIVTMNANQMSDWTAWRKRFFSQLPLGYRAGEFIFPMSTVESYLETIADSNNNPIFRQATGLEVSEYDADGRFFGRAISIVEPDIIADFDSAAAGDVVGIYWQPEEYAINENFGFTMRRYFDEETNEWVDKALVVVDGKVLNPTGYYKIVKA